MTEPVKLALHNPSSPAEVQSRIHTLHICISCRVAKGSEAKLGIRDGLTLYQQLRDEIEGSQLNGRVKVIPTECLSVCPRPCGIAFSSPNSWSYLFGDQNPDETINDIVKCLSFYIESPDGFMPRSQRPKSMRNSILGRIPPAAGGN